MSDTKLGILSNMPLDATEFVAQKNLSVDDLSGLTKVELRSSAIFLEVEMSSSARKAELITTLAEFF